MDEVFALMKHYGQVANSEMHVYFRKWPNEGRWIAKADYYSAEGNTPLEAVQECFNKYRERQLQRITDAESQIESARKTLRAIDGDEAI